MNPTDPQPYFIAMFAIIAVWLFVYAIMDGKDTREMYNKTKGL